MKILSRAVFFMYFIFSLPARRPIIKRDMSGSHDRADDAASYKRLPAGKPGHVYFTMGWGDG